MPEILEDETPTSLPFPPVTQAHIMNCSYHNWHPKYKAVTPKSRIIPLTQAFLEYLRADGIVLPDDEEDRPVHEWDSDSGVFSASDNPNDDSEEEDDDIAEGWRDVHETIKSTIAELGGKVLPKLNWSAPKDATWMNANTMECRTPNDIYLLLKSSDFITHDLEHPFDDTVTTPACTIKQAEIPYHLVLRKAFQMNPSLEFRCFVRNRRLLCMCQRDLNHFDFLEPMEGKLRSLIQQFFDLRMRDTFEDENFVMDVYVPAPYNRVWLVDVNPWAPRTDPLLFSWLEILTMPEPPVEGTEGFVRLSLNGDAHITDEGVDGQADDEDSDSDSDSSADEELWLPEFRLVKHNDPEAYSFATPQYSAHKLPKDVVDASQSGEGLREFARDWEDILAKRRKAEDDGQSSGDDA
ncbi:hypothetical protein LTR56_006280 [Elasticomyces elasticus]|nr:hypothetical protein LTR56_006280 [Elasticomyces elasticus]KAK3666511.1 hypothetical protein LTR22_002455 [Elasticomyces elasticus]KAK4928356.1 hypothetical protein LTR49_005033 [Elasticomyces elasticus]KAK5753613.1 hypothetical protein LTS12_016250 [Elasticomyces elasticus]